MQEEVTQKTTLQGLARINRESIEKIYGRPSGNWNRQG